MKLNNIEADLYKSGYRNEPPHGGATDAGSIDHNVCQELSCTICGHQGMRYVPFTKPGSYRAFAECPKCGEAEEF